MNNNVYVLPVSATFREIKYPEPVARSQEDLEKKLRGKDLNIKLKKKILDENYTYEYAAILDDQKVIVKHAEDFVPAHPIEVYVKKERLSADAKAMKHMAKSDAVKGPTLLHSFPPLSTVVVEDYRASGYKSLKDMILKKNINPSIAETIGERLAHLALISQPWSEFKTSESAHLSYYRHSVEFLTVYPKQIDRYYEIEKVFTQYTDDKEEMENKKRHFVWADAQPKNIFVNKDGEVLFANFERSYWGDQTFSLAVFLAHITVMRLLKKITPKKGQNFVNDTFKAYKSVKDDVDEAMLCKYIGIEILHRSFGRWLPEVSSAKDKQILLEAGMSIFDSNIKTVSALAKKLK